MRTVTFKRGIHPHDAKSTAGSAIKTIAPKAGWEFVFPMSQHLGAPCEPIVAKGERVLVGQKIGDSKANVSAPIHSSVSGTVTDIRRTLTPTGQTCNAVVIENDGENKEHEALNKKSNYERMKNDEILKLIREAGIVGLGGAGFPTHIKLNPPNGKKIEYIIVNAAECEPYLTTDHRVLLEEGDKLVRGLRALLKLHPNAKGIIGVETNKQDAIRKLVGETDSMPDIEIVSLKPKYPQGAEKQLIYACCGREVPSGGLPADVGCIVDNVDTVVAVERALLKSRPLMRRIITVAGDAAASPGNYKVRLGMSYRMLMDEIGGYRTVPGKLISGGPMMGIAMFTLDVPIIKTSSALLVLTENSAELPVERNCIRCGRCVKICPMGLMPLELDAFMHTGEAELFEKFNGADCIECGSCTYICPAKRHLAQSIRLGRREVLDARRKRAATPKGRVKNG